MARKLFANPQKVNMTMKKYISPIAKSIELYGEAALLAGSDPEVHNELGGEGQDSNRRHNSIWGDNEW